jgi:hydrogenase maturation factor HypF (carbamoyltransferase family)
MQGPPLARVARVKAEHIDYDKTYQGFEIRG